MAVVELVTGTVGAATQETPASSAAGAHTRRSVSSLEAENTCRCRALADTRLDVEVLQKATAYFAMGS